MGEVIAEKGRSVAEIENDVRRVRDELEEMERNDLVEGRPPLEKRLAELTEELDRARAEESSEYDDVT